ncbi:MAG: hypothetical protein IPP72_20780 [Chitinophagaceae bacterium]|nr:hypothetical protein [Chitinophagaceae bacterium]
MKAAWNILSKIMVKQFYIANAGFFLFLFLFFFGIVQAGQLIWYHHSLMLAMISSPLFLFIVMTAWLLYNCKCILFCTSVIQSGNGGFLYMLRALPFSKQLLLYVFVGTVLYLPVLAYACILATVAYTTGAAIVSVQVAAYQLLMIIISTTAIYSAINKTGESAVTKLVATLGSLLSIRIGYHAFLITYILHSRKVTFAVVKLFSLLMLSMLFVRNSDSFDTDLFSIFYPLTITAHAALVLHCVDFNETLLQCNRNLPLHWLKVACMYLLTWFIILLPEAAFMLINNHGNMPVDIIILQSMAAVACLLLFTGMAYACGLDMERYLLFVFMVYIILLILQKSAGHLVTLAAFSALALAVFQSHYYSFEREK